jgi:tRNA-specific 2-thiouridylase
MSKIAVLVSGGVDSSVALALLKNQGHDVVAFYIKIWLEDDLHFLGDCPWQEDLNYVRAVTDKLNVPLQVISLQQDYWDKVISNALSDVRLGNTPNPDMLCNSKIKFGEFFKYIDESFDYVATGHYADKITIEGIEYLRANPDPVKDQTYFLSRLTKEQINKALFPIGQLTKKEIRAIAKELDLPTKDRKDSQGICFLGKISYSEFIKHHLGEKTGDIVDIKSGKIIGKHNGSWFFTIGQRKGIHIHGGPWFVVKKDTQNNIIFVSTDKKLTLSKSFKLNDVHFFSDKKFDNISIRIRHGGNKIIGSIDDSNIVELVDNEFGIASGQFAVIYNDDIVVGSGIIEQIL